MDKITMTPLELFREKITTYTSSKEIVDFILKHDMLSIASNFLVQYVQSLKIEKFTGDIFLMIEANDRELTFEPGTLFNYGLDNNEHYYTEHIIVTSREFEALLEMDDEDFQLWRKLQ